MGLRYRKSINLGGGFRINLSKSGVGYSWGGKGFRVTKTAKGKTRTTASIPGTGLSWVEESGGRKQRSGTQPQKAIPQQPNSTYSHSIESAEASELVSARLQDFIGAIKHYRAINAILTWVAIALWGVFAYIVSQLPDSPLPVFMMLIAIFGVIAKLLFKSKGKVRAQYEFDEYGEKRIALIAQLIDVLQTNKALWQVNDVFRNSVKRTNAGASQSVTRITIKLQTKKPSFLKTNVKCYFVKLKKEKLFILPDKIIVVNKGKVGAIDLEDLNILVGDTSFVENIAPRDATIIRHTWQFVNNNGTPDKRFKNNRQLPVCRYGTISFKTAQGFNTLIYCSNINTAAEFFNILDSHKSSNEV